MSQSFRFVPGGEGTLHTIDYCARAATELHRLGLFAFVEPLPQEHVDGKFQVNASVPRRYPRGRPLRADRARRRHSTR